MVLSNKKLKQKLRAELAESTDKNLPRNHSDSRAENPETPKSLKQLLDSAAHKSRLSKREKRRKTLNLRSPKELENGSNVENKVAHVGETDNGKGKKRKREKRRSEDQKTGRVDGELGEKKQGGDLKKEEETSKKNAKKKKKQKRKKQKKGKVGKQEKQAEVTNGVASEQTDPQNVEYNNSQVNDVDAKKVYVGGIPFYSTEDDIRSFFDHCGTITHVDCMTFPESGRFRGIAIISFKTEEAAKRALAMDGSDMGGLYLKIQPYKYSCTIKPSTTDFCPPVMAGYNRIYAGNLSWDITEDDLKKLFSDCNVSTIRFGEDKETGEFRGYAHVDFADHASVTKALKFDQRVVCGRPVRIRCAVPPKKGDVRNAGSSAASATAVKTETANSKTENENNMAENENSNNGGVSSGKLRRRTCYECGEKGHIYSACPKKQDPEQKNPTAT